MREDRADGHHPGAFGHSSRARSRSLTFWILPVLVMGNSSTKATWRGILKLATRPRQCSITSRSVSAEPGVRHPDDRGHLDRGMAHQKRLDFHGIDVLAADLQHVPIAAEKPQVAVGAHHTHVARVKPSVPVEGP